MKSTIVKAMALLTLLWSAMLFAAEPIKIGAFVAATGPDSFLGDPELKTLKHHVAKTIHHSSSENEAFDSSLLIRRKK
ncbi:hypothetical protein [Nitratifractor sp.]